MVCRAFSLIFVLLLQANPIRAQQRESTIQGIVSDIVDGLPLQGAAVTLSRSGLPGISHGVTTDRGGQYRLDRIPPGSYALVVRYLGYDEARRTVVLDPSQSYTFDFGLEQSNIDLHTIVVSASRDEEKVQDAVSAISVVTGREIQRDVAASSAATLRMATGVDYAQTGIDRREIALRGFNNSLTGETYVLTDFRISAVPGLALNAYGLMPIATLDIDRVEIVRGPGSALYGSGVDQGLIQFVTKSPFLYPGTSVSIGGGERGVMDFELRQAGRVPGLLGGNLAYKIVGEYAGGDDWSLNPADSTDLGLIVAEGGTGRDSEFWKYGLNGALEYRPGDDTHILLNGGYHSQKMALLTGIGAAQTDDFSYAYGQLRMQAGDFLAQAYLNHNNSGASFYYGPTAIAADPLDIEDKTLLFNAQTQYKITTLNERERLLIGSDFKLTLPRTAGTMHGRNENADQIGELGAYLHSSTLVTDRLDVTAALRADYNNLDEKIRLSPRAGLVFEMAPSHTMRFAANRAFGAPGLSANFLDRNVSTIYTASSYGLVLQGRGARRGFTFDNYREQQKVTFLIPDLGDLQHPSSPTFFGMEMSIAQIPIAPIYESFANSFSNVLVSGENLPADLVQLTAAGRAAFAQLLTRLSPFIAGSVEGTLGVPAVTEEGFMAVDGPVDVAPLKQSATGSIEVGYKGVFRNQIVLSVDAYVSRKKNFVGPLMLESPYVFVPDIEEDIRTRILPLVEDFTEADPDLAALLDDLGLSVAAAAGLIAEIAADGYGDFSGYARTPVAVVEPDQSTLPENAAGRTIGGLLTYRNFGNVSFWGLDAALEYLFSDRIRLFAHTSFVSDDYFDHAELGEDNPNFAVALNAPAFKFGGGFDYQFPTGLSVRMAGRFASEFPVLSGPFVGVVEDYAVVDAGVGFDFGRQISGLRLDVTAQNLFTFVDGKQKTMHREFVGAPKIGRLAMARLVFTF